MFAALAMTTMMMAYPAPREQPPSDKGFGYLGVLFEPTPDGEGIQVKEIRADGPAFNSGLRPEDIIRKFDGTPVNFESFAAAIVGARPGTLVPLEVERDSERLTVKIRLGARPDDLPLPPIRVDAANPPADDLPPPRP